jgi:hypothetical protein
MFAIGVVEREATGVTSWAFALWKAKRFNYVGLQSRDNGAVLT